MSYCNRGVWSGHYWEKWEKKTVIVAKADPILPGAFMKDDSGKTAEFIRPYQERHCLLCGLVEQKDLEYGEHK